MDIATPAGLAAMLASLNQSVGLNRVPVIHTNDSRSPLGSHRDRHEHIGKGGIGREGFRRIVNHPALRDKVFILETPIEAEGDERRNLKAIRSVREDAVQPGRGIARLRRRMPPKPRPAARTGSAHSTELKREARL